VTKSTTDMKLQGSISINNTSSLETHNRNTTTMDLWNVLVCMYNDAQTRSTQATNHTHAFRYRNWTDGLTGGSNTKDAVQQRPQRSGGEELAPCAETDFKQAATLLPPCDGRDDTSVCNATQQWRNGGKHTSATHERQRKQIPPCCPMFTI
jgi:hypothetical protein